MIPHVHTEVCQKDARAAGLRGCERVEDLPLEGRTITQILDIRDLHAEIHRRNRAPRAGDGRWWRKLLMKIAYQAAAIFLALIGLVIAKWWGIADLMLALLKAISP